MRIDSTIFDFSAMDVISNQNTPIHRLDPRSKIISTLLFIICIVSFGQYEISALIPFIVYPIVLIELGKLPLRYLLKKILFAAPFAVFIGIFNPIMDREIYIRIGAIAFSGGWISFGTIMLKFLLTAGAALILIACTGFNSICAALQKMRIPQPFVIQLLFLYRYLFVLVEEATRMSRARSLRTFCGKGTGIKVFSSMAGNFLLRTTNRAQRIHLAMLCRGFDGTLRHFVPLKFGTRDIFFTIGWCALFITMRLINVSYLFGTLIKGALT